MGGPGRPPGGRVTAPRARLRSRPPGREQRDDERGRLPRRPGAVQLPRPPGADPVVAAYDGIARRHRLQLGRVRRHHRRGAPRGRPRGRPSTATATPSGRPRRSSTPPVSGSTSTSARCGGWARSTSSRPTSPLGLQNVETWRVSLGDSHRRRRERPLHRARRGRPRRRAGRPPAARGGHDRERPGSRRAGRGHHRRPRRLPHVSRLPEVDLAAGPRPPLRRLPRAARLHHHPARARLRPAASALRARRPPASTGRSPCRAAAGGGSRGWRWPGPTRRPPSCSVPRAGRS